MVYFLYPETKGLHLEQIDHIFEGRAQGLECLTQGVRESVKSHPTADLEGSLHEEKAYGEHSERTSQSVKEDVPAATNVEDATRM